MKRPLLKLIILLLICCYAGNAEAQVRIGRMAKMSHKQKKARRQYEKIAKKKKPAAPVAAVIIPAKPSDTRTELDARFYVPWGSVRKLKYDDFLCNKNLYNKFLPARDTDLARVIYPDYREFYRRLNERINKTGGLDDDFWQERIERLLKERSDSMAGDIMALPWIDTGFSFAIAIDSPAASVITISPLIYPINETSYYYNITALFSKNESWMIVKSADILEHEQIHFDIFEVYARKMRKFLIETLKKNYDDGTISDITNDINPTYEQMYQQINDMQLEFDRQTALVTAANGSLKKTNTNWIKLLQTQLDELKDYALTEGTITLK